ncbi:DoxX family membrane protein [Paenibacillus thermoaerophilus]|nr:DoxX family membrane protein [Paenibacillus thermoaerophilus]
MNWWRNNIVAAWGLLVLRLYLGWMWLEAGWHKITDGFTAKGFLTNAVAKPVADKATGELIYPTYTAFIEHFALPNVKLIDFLIPWGELLVGLGLILGTLTTAAAFFGLLMNFMFLMAGTVSTNPWMVLIGTLVLVAGANAGRIGGDLYVLPYLRKLWNRMFGGRGGDGKLAGNAAGRTV